ncbi:MULTISPECIES: acrEF/envCD operon transcriptional regulator [Enterobacterales]|uniref:acrEF/envCD operon transcriptional regulator n=1 Tax=Enterobacterales TaxID=91347 RepID=UPI002EDB5143
MVRKTKADALITRQKLIDAAIEQFARRGVSETTLTDIADAAGVTRGAVYWHFTSKAEIFNEMWSQQYPLRDIIKHKLTHNENENPLAFMRESFTAALQYISRSPKQQALMQILFHKCEFNSEMMPESEIRQRIGFSYEILQALLRKCISNGSLPAETNIELSLLILHSFFSGVVKNWLLSPERLDLYHQAPELVESIMSTLLPHPAMQVMSINNSPMYHAQVG